MPEKKRSARWIRGAAATAEVLGSWRELLRMRRRLERRGAAAGAVLRPLQVLQRCPALEWLLEAVAAAAGKAGSTRGVLLSCPGHVRRRRGNEAVGRSLQLLQRIPVEPGDRGRRCCCGKAPERAAEGRRSYQEVAEGRRGPVTPNRHRRRPAITGEDRAHGGARKADKAVKSGI